MVSYTWSKSIDESSMYDTNVAWLGIMLQLWIRTRGSQQAQLERALSTFDVPQMLKFSYSYDLPIGRGKALLGNMPRVLDAMIGGWKTNGIWSSTRAAR